jgi:hypothetical protein
MEEPGKISSRDAAVASCFVEYDLNNAKLGFLLLNFDYTATESGMEKAS